MPILTFNSSPLLSAFWQHLLQDSVNCDKLNWSNSLHWVHTKLAENPKDLHSSIDSKLLFTVSKYAWKRQLQYCLKYKKQWKNMYIGHRYIVTLSFPFPAKLNRYVFGKSKGITPEETKWEI